jgi:hypothetical protein
LPPEERLHELSTHEIETESDLRDAAHSNLRARLSDFIHEKVFLPGLEIRCQNCLATLWFHIDELQTLLVCKGCRKELPLPAETPWAYSLNELIASAVRDQGVVPVIRTLSKLFERTDNCFCFLAGIEIRDYEAKKNPQLAELDLVWIKDGTFGIAEIKNKPKKFKYGQGLGRVLQRVRPDIFLLVSSSGTLAEMKSIGSEFQNQVPPHVKIEVWDPTVFNDDIPLDGKAFVHRIL